MLGKRERYSEIEDAYGRTKERMRMVDSIHNMLLNRVFSLAGQKRVLAQYNDLQECYLQKRHGARQSYKQEARDVIHANAMNTEGYHAGLEDFQSALQTLHDTGSFTCRLRVIAELRHGDLFHLANFESSIEFDRDDELFATAGVSRCIKVFEFAAVVNEQMWNVQLWKCPHGLNLVA